MWQDHHAAFLLLSVQEALSEPSRLSLQGFVTPFNKRSIADERKR
jgi:hypothetical protein